MSTTLRESRGELYIWQIIAAHETIKKGKTPLVAISVALTGITGLLGNRRRALLAPHFISSRERSVCYKYILSTSLAQWRILGFEWEVPGSISAMRHFKVLTFLIWFWSGLVGGFGIGYSYKHTRRFCVLLQCCISLTIR